MAVTTLRQARLLLASVPSSATDSDLQALLEDLSDQVSEVGARGVVVDVSALDVLDSFATRVLETIGQVTRMRGADTVIVGIQPSVAMAMVQLGVTLEAVDTAFDLEDGMRRFGTEVPGDGHDGD